ncbi:MAG: PHB depolymerase family esterase [Pseudomonadota bacterium]
MIARLISTFVVLMWGAQAGAIDQIPPSIHQTLTLNHDGRARSYHLHLPPDTQGDVPLVVVLHGLGGHANKLRYGLGLNSRADKLGYAVVYPQGLESRWGPHWNAGFPFSDVDDVGFLTKLAQDLQEAYQIDPERTYVLGISVGGFMAYHLACHAPDVFRAQAVVLGSMSGEDWANCAPKDPVSILHIHGTNDPLIPYDGSDHWASGWGGAGAIPQVVERWANRQEAQPVAPTFKLPGATTNSYKNQPTGTEVTLISLQGYGHDWPHEENSSISAADVVFEFFNRVQTAPE